MVGAPAGGCLGWVGRPGVRRAEPRLSHSAREGGLQVCMAALHTRVCECVDVRPSLSRRCRAGCAKLLNVVSRDVLEQLATLQVGMAPLHTHTRVRAGMWG